MNREIKFRAWEKSYKRMSKVTEIKWKEEHLYHQIFTQAIVNNKRIDDSYTYNFSGVSNGIVLMQYTGLKDKNGVEIYEGDIAIHKDYECFGKVVFSDDELAFAFLVVTGSNNKGPTTEFEWLHEYADGLEVIGNIYENEEMTNND